MIHVRPARKTDVPRMMEIARQSTFAAQWKEDAYLRLLAAQGQPCVGLVAEENETVLGFLFARRVGGGVWEVENVAVYEPARRRGLASHLLDEFIELARSGAGNAIYLEVRESNQAACALYQKHGFLEAGVRKSYYQNPQEDALILRFFFPQNG